MGSKGPRVANYTTPDYSPETDKLPAQAVKQEASLALNWIA